jgi:hypothetical protein
MDRTVFVSSGQDIFPGQDLGKTCIIEVHRDRKGVRRPVRWRHVLTRYSPAAGWLSSTMASVLPRSVPERGSPARGRTRSRAALRRLGASRGMRTMSRAKWTTSTHPPAHDDHSPPPTCFLSPSSPSPPASALRSALRTRRHAASGAPSPTASGALTRPTGNSSSVSAANWRTARTG